MKLQTSIQPRRDGTVKVTGQDRQPYVFAADDNGDLVCDISDEPTIAFLLATDNFFPADPADHDKALALTEALTKNEGGEGGDGDAGDDEEDDDEVETEVVNGGLPIEAGTPPMVSPDQAAKHNDAVLAAKAAAKPAKAAKAKPGK